MDIIILLRTLHCAGVNIQLAENDFRGTEPEESITITVNKNVRIATDVNLTITPVVASEARRLNVFPMEISPPDDNGGRSPVEASERTYCIPQFVNFAHQIKDYNARSIIFLQ